MKNYVVIGFNEDGDLPSVEELTADQLRTRLKEHYWGERPVFAEPGQSVGGDSFVGLVIIEGRIVKPRPVEVAVEYDL